MPKKVAVIIDGGFLLKEFGRFRNITARQRIELSHIRAVADAAVQGGEEELFRVYYYHCPPYAGQQQEPFTATVVDFARTPVASWQTALQQDIRLAPNFAYRRGVIRWRGWTCSPRNVAPETKAKDLRWRPNLSQKQVDIKIGLDIAWLASKGIADIIAIVSGDTDFVPAMKFARREGVQVRLITFKQRAGGPHHNLVEHSDFVTTVDLEQVARTIP